MTLTRSMARRAEAEVTRATELKQANDEIDNFCVCCQVNNVERGCGCKNGISLGIACRDFAVLTTVFVVEVSITSYCVFFDFPVNRFVRCELISTWSGGCIYLFVLTTIT